MGTQNDAVTSGLVSFETSQGVELRGTLHRLTRHKAVFESYSPEPVLRLSEVLSQFSLFVGERPVYSGKAVISNLIQNGPCTVCETTLDEGSWRDIEFNGAMAGNGKLREDFGHFIQEWQKLYKILPEFKVVIADMHSFFTELRLFLDQVELQIRASPSEDRQKLERVVVDELGGLAGATIDTFIDRFEAIAEGLEEDLAPAHRIYLRRHLHPFVLCSPFAYRTYHKPLGYAGDYRIVDMMIRPQYEGSTLFAKAVNSWLLSQAPAQAHRNRIQYLVRKLTEEAARLQRSGRTGRVYNLGCGPAGEIQEFLRQSILADSLQFTLVDFNEETLTHARATLEAAKRANGRSAQIQLVRCSVQQLLKEAGKSAGRSPQNQYDFVYCAGLFDYLNNNICKRVVKILYDMLAPGGLLITTNVSDAMNQSRPFRYSMEYILDWHLIYRDGPQVAALKPELAPEDNVRVIAEESGVNIFLEVRKPADA